LEPRGSIASRIVPLGPAETQVWWATTTGEPIRGHEWLLADVERIRRDGFRATDDRNRFTVGVVLCRLLLAVNVGVAADQVVVDRTCDECQQPHGRPRLADPASPLRVSVSHSGDVVAVAISAVGAVGIDVERLPAQVGVARAASLVLSPAEAETVRACAAADRDRAFMRYWTRKEAIVKATGDGLRTPLSGLTVSPWDRPPRLLAWESRPDVVGRVTLSDLGSELHDMTSLAVLSDQATTVTQWDAREVLAQTSR
jgi:4'-phosphopantetheinyl transferase